MLHLGKVRSRFVSCHRNPVGAARRLCCLCQGSQNFSNKKSMEGKRSVLNSPWSWFSQLLCRLPAGAGCTDGGRVLHMLSTHPGSSLRWQQCKQTQAWASHPARLGGGEGTATNHSRNGWKAKVVLRWHSSVFAKFSSISSQVSLYLKCGPSLSHWRGGIQEKERLWKNKGDEVLAEYPRLKLAGNHNWILLDPTGEVSLISQLSLSIYPHGISSFFWILLHPSMYVDSLCQSTADPKAPWPHILFKHKLSVLTPVPGLPPWGLHKGWQGKELSSHSSALDLILDSH